MEPQPDAPQGAAAPHPAGTDPVAPSRPKHQREVQNFVALTVDLASGRSVWNSKPYYLEYSTNSACNLRCIMCSQVENPPVVSTPLKDQEPFLDEVLELTTLWTPSATSEPLLNNFKRLKPLIEKHRVYLDIITNAMLLTEEVLADLLPHLHRLTLSVDSHKKDVFERLRAPAVFETVVENSAHATATCRAAGVPVVYHMVLVDQVLEELPDYVDFVADLGGTSITVLELLDASPLCQDMDPFATRSEAEVGRYLDAMKVRAAERGVTLIIEVRPPLGGEWRYGQTDVRIQSGSVLEMMQAELAEQHVGFCPMAMSYLKVEPDGEAFPCCRAPRELRLGNVFTDGGVEGVWNGKPMQDLREKMRSGDYPEPCVGCLVLETPKWRLEGRKNASS